MAHALQYDGARNDQSDEEETPIRSSFSLEDLLHEVEKISSAPTYGKKVEVVVRLWKNGFTVNDDPLRSYITDESQAFLEALKRGELPSELEGRAYEEELEVRVEEMKDQLYVPKKKKMFLPFSGRGYRLGSAAPSVVATSRSVQEDCPVPLVELDEALPSTRLQIWLADGRRLTQRFNLSHRISDVHAFVEEAQTTRSSFILTTTLPFRVLTQWNQSLEEADLKMTVIVQRLVSTRKPFGRS